MNYCKSNKFLYDYWSNDEELMSQSLQVTNPDVPCMNIGCLAQNQKLKKKKIVFFLQFSLEDRN